MDFQPIDKNTAIKEALDELDLISDYEAELLLRGLKPFATAETQSFRAPMSPSEWLGRRQCNLVLVVYPEMASTADFVEIASKVKIIDPNINPVVIVDRIEEDLALPSVPTLVVAPTMIKCLKHLPGRILCGMPLNKSQEYERLNNRRIPVPRWSILTQSKKPDLSSFPDYVVCKPNLGGQGAHVKIVKKNRVEWKPVVTQALGVSHEILVQEFIETGPRAIVYRVTTLFGRVLESHRFEGGCGLLSPTGKPYGGSHIVASSKGAMVTLNYDEQVIQFGERAHQAFPEIPVLGVDIVREIKTGKLYVLEVNSIGYVWHFTSQTGKGIEMQIDMLLKNQFDAIARSAYILAEATQRWAK